MRRAWISIAVAGVCLAGAARAQAQSVRLVDPECAALPFSTARVRELVELELGLDGRGLTEASDAAIALGYRPDPCEPGAAVYAIEVRNEDGRVQVEQLTLDEVPLASVPRAVALSLVEALRGERTPLPAAEPEVEEVEEPAVDLEEPAAVATAPEPPAHDVAPANGHGAPTRISVGANFRNTPDTGAALGGLRVGIDLPLGGPDVPLTARLDVALAFGATPEGLGVGFVDGGVFVGVFAVAAPGVALRFGPRLWVGHGFVLSGSPTRTSGDVAFGLGVLVGLDISLTPWLDLIVQAEVGTHFHGLRVDVAAQSTGVDGAYWAADTGLAFRF